MWHEPTQQLELLLSRYNLNPNTNNNDIITSIDVSFLESISAKLIVDNIDSLLKSILEINTNFKSTNHDANFIPMDSSKIVAKLNQSNRSDSIITILLYGNFKQVQIARTYILKNYYQIDKQIIPLPIDYNFFNYDDGKLLPELTKGLNDISKFWSVSIFITDFIEDLPLNLFGVSSTSSSSNQSLSKYHIYIYGNKDNVNFATTRIELLIDKISKKIINVIDEIPLSLLPLIGGCKFANFKTISLQTNTKIYLPNILPEVLSSNDTSLTENKHPHDLNLIFISGKSSSKVLLAKSIIIEIYNKVIPKIYYQSCVINIMKNELLVLQKYNSLTNIMKKYGCFLQLPEIGSNRAIIRIQANSNEFAKKGIDDLMSLLTDYYEVLFIIHDGQIKNIEGNQEIYLPPSINNFPPKTISEISKHLDRISLQSGSTISFSNFKFNILGFRQDSKKATSMLRSLPFLIKDDLKLMIRYRLELAVEQREFIAGRKNGKIHRIMNSTSTSTSSSSSSSTTLSNGVFIKFNPFNEYNFYIDLLSNNYESANFGLKLLEEELPSEISFYIPEVYHKQVIGTGGSAIQQLMRKFNVFIKFSNGYDMIPNLYSHIVLDNVLIRCPTKNSKNIPFAKKELENQIKERSEEHLNTFINLSLSHKYLILSNKSDLILNVEKKTNTFIMFPDPYKLNLNELGDNLIEIRGFGISSDDAARLIKANSPLDYVFKIAYSIKFHDIFINDNEEFLKKIVVPFRIGLKFEVQVVEEPEFINSSSSNSNSNLITNTNIGGNVNNDDTNNENKIKNENENENENENININKGNSDAKYHRIILSYSQDYSAGLPEAIKILTSFLRDLNLDIIDRGEIETCTIEKGTASGHRKTRTRDFKRFGGDEFRNNNNNRHNHDSQKYTSQRGGYYDKKDSRPSPREYVGGYRDSREYRDYRDYESRYRDYDPRDNLRNYRERDARDLELERDARYYPGAPLLHAPAPPTPNQSGSFLSPVPPGYRPSYRPMSPERYPIRYAPNEYDRPPFYEQQPLAPSLPAPSMRYEMRYPQSSPPALGPAPINPSSSTGNHPIGSENYRSEPPYDYRYREDMISRNAERSRYRYP